VLSPEGGGGRHPLDNVESKGVCENPDGRAFPAPRGPCNEYCVDASVTPGALVQRMARKRSSGQHPIKRVEEADMFMMVATPCLQGATMQEREY